MQKLENRGLRILLIGIVLALVGIGGAYIVYQIYGTGAADLLAYLAYGLVVPGILLALIGGTLHLSDYFGNKTKTTGQKKR